MINQNPTIKTNVLTYGRGRPHIVTVGPLHGDEYSVVIAQNELAEKAATRTLDGKLTIINLPNPYATLFGTRNEPFNQRDLNRSFGSNGDSNNGHKYHQTIANDILNIAKSADLVIDLHNYADNDVLSHLIVFDNQINLKVARRSVELGLKLGLPRIEIQSKRPEEAADLSATLGYSLTSLSIPNITVELTLHHYITSKEIDSLADKILDFLKPDAFASKIDLSIPLRFPNLEVVDSIVNKQTFAAFLRNDRYHPGSKVKKGNIVGKSYDLVSNTSSNIHVNKEGIIYLLSPSRLCHPGSSLVKVAQKTISQI